MRRLLRENLGLKLASVLLAYLLWIIVVGRPPRAELISVEVRFDAGADLLVVDHDPKLIEMRVEGDRSFWDEDRLREVFVFMDVSSLGPGRFQRSVGRLDVEMLPLDFDVKILTTTIDFEIEEKSSTEVRVNPSIAGEIPEGYRIVGVSAEPEKVSAVGPVSRIKELERVGTEPVVVEGRRTRMSRRVRVATPQENISLEPLMVDVVVDIEELRASRTVELDVAAAAGSWSFEPPRVAVELSGPESRIEDVVGAARAIASPAPSAQRVREVPVAVIFAGLDPETANRVEVVTTTPATVSASKR